MEYVTSQILNELYQTFHALCTNDLINVAPPQTPAIEKAQGKRKRPKTDKSISNRRRAAKMSVQSFAELYKAENNIKSGPQITSQEHVKDLGQFFDLLKLIDESLGSIREETKLRKLWKLWKLWKPWKHRGEAKTEERQSETAQEEKPRAKSTKQDPSEAKDGE